MRLEVDTSDRVVYSDEVRMVILPARQGQMGVLEDHADFVVMLKAGLLRAHKESGTETISIGEGYAEISGNRVVVLTD